MPSNPSKHLTVNGSESGTRRGVPGDLRMVLMSEIRPRWRSCRAVSRDYSGQWNGRSLLPANGRETRVFGHASPLYMAETVCGPDRVWDPPAAVVSVPTFAAGGLAAALIALAAGPASAATTAV